MVLVIGKPWSGTVDFVFQPLGEAGVLEGWIWGPGSGMGHLAWSILGGFGGGFGRLLGWFWLVCAQVLRNWEYYGFGVLVLAQNTCFWVVFGRLGQFVLTVSAFWVFLDLV